MIFHLLFITTIVRAGTISGIVTDKASKEILPGATIRLKGNGISFTTSTNLEGKYSFKNLKIGQYTIVVSIVGYNSLELEANLSTDVAVVNAELELHTVVMKSVVVKSSGGSSERVNEKNANQIVNVLSAKTIQLLPDITVANVMQRVSGVVIDRSSSGEGRYPVIRGMDKRYNTTLVNGIKIPSPDNNNRYVPLDLFPSELLQNLEVSKSLNPSMEGDAIGGTINLVMKDAPEKLFLQANVSVGYSTIFGSQPFESFSHSVINKKSPAENNVAGYVATSKDFPKDNLNLTNKPNPVNSTYGLTIGNRFGRRRQFGAVISGSYQDIYRGTNSSFFFPTSQPAIGNVPAFSDIFLRNYSFEDRRLGLYTKLDYQLSPGQKISLFATYINTNQFQTRNTIDSVLSIQRTGPGNGNVLIQKRTTWTEQTILNTTLQGKHDLGKRFLFDWSAVYSAAKQQIPDQAAFTTLHAITTNHAGVATSTPEMLDGQMIREWFHNTDKDASLYLNLTYKTTVLHRNAEFKAGGLVRHKKRDNYYNPYTLAALLSSTSTAQLYTNIYNAQYDFFGVYAGGTGEINANTYSTTENIYAGYVQGKIMLTPKLEALGGLRVEHTYDHYQTVQPEVADGRFGTIYYNDLLPSLQLKYSLTSKQNLRLAYYKAISRPGYFEIVPTSTVTDYFVLNGNNALDRSTADNVDLRYEFFPGKTDQVLIGGFYKRIKNPIELTTQSQSSTYSSALKLTPVNFGVATNFGAEVTVTKYVGNFGVMANYTYTHSRVTTSKSYLSRDASGQISSTDVSDTRPLQGQADHIANVSLLYKSFKNGLDMQIAYVYTGSRIILVSPYLGLDYYQNPGSQLDFSMEKAFLKKFSVYAKVNNITNSPLTVQIHQPNAFLTGRYALPLQESSNAITVQKDYYKLSFLLGFRYHL
ncbi:TonB-dependent receptor [Chitinophaga sp. 212800010-3]|uniref:TonB-dependent receptor n=1 Tax=unclassified Chitinophaga TaxID=2619133 RepID=UPI002E0D81F1